MLNCSSKLRRRLRDVCCIALRRRRLILPVSAPICVLLIFYTIERVHHQPAKIRPSCESIDVVYTWVNGSDLNFIADLKTYAANYDPVRFDDKHELKYSLRSLEEHAPWVRHVYIVTNGQIPHWLDLSYERVSIITHNQLTPNLQWLPTFSSAAIETFLHRIPGLSQRFLYLNDDIFLGAPLYPDDLYTESEGVRVYTAWTVPDCANDCPWVYIGDGACDEHCNIEECQHDGGDCANTTPQRGAAYSNREQQVLRKITKKRGSTSQQLRKIVGTFNEGLAKRSRNQTANAAAVRLTTPAASSYPALASKSYQSSKDIYSESLVHTNMLLNRHYGFRPRNVLSHVGFLLDKRIVEEMQQKFRAEFATTAAQRFRAATDIQFAFMYYSYLMSESYNASVEQIFAEFDTDDSLTWSDREVRTFLARIYPLPLEWSGLRYFDEVIENCTQQLGPAAAEQALQYTTLVYERYEDSNLPPITRALVNKCEVLANALLSNFGQRQKYKYNMHAKRGTHSNFMMLTSNITDVVDGLDRIRHSSKKFNCINDNLDPAAEEENDFIRHLLEDFYLSFFPRRSQFELQEHYRNRFSNLDDYSNWKRRKFFTLATAYGASIVLIIILLRFLCWHKAKFARRYVQRL